MAKSKVRKRLMTYHVNAALVLHFVTEVHWQSTRITTSNTYELDGHSLYKYD